METHLELLAQPDLPVEKQETLHDWAENTTDEMEDLQATLHDKIPGNVSGNLDIHSVLRGRQERLPATVYRVVESSETLQLRGTFTLRRTFLRYVEHNAG